MAQSITPADVNQAIARARGKRGQQRAVTAVHGIPVVPGLAYGQVHRYDHGVELPAAQLVPEAERASHSAALTQALEAVAQEYTDQASSLEGPAAHVLQTTASLVQDRALVKSAQTRIERGDTAALAFDGATKQFADVFAAAGGLMAERVTDLQDINRRVVARLLGRAVRTLADVEHPSVIVAEDLSPADTATLDPTAVVAIVTERGGPTSHTAIIARQLGIPCVVAATRAADLFDGQQLLVDGSTGLISVDPEPVAAMAAVAEDVARRKSVDEWSGPCQTRDGHSVKLLANVQDATDAKVAREHGAAGVGLLRTELAFLNASVEPTVAEQASIYQGVCEQFAGSPVVVRTLDAGSDKPLAFAPSHDEPNPALGVRGIRLQAGDAAVLERQITAIAQAAQSSKASVQVMAPMISTPAEAAMFAELVRPHGLPVGVMIEVPSAAIMISDILAAVDFVSIGTNDLTQYVMAADRMAPTLAHLNDPWQPAVLALINGICAAGQLAGKPVGVCGEAAADPLLACVLVGLGVTSLSCAGRSVKMVGAQISSVTMAECTQAAQAALQASSAQAARSEAAQVLR